MRLSSARPLAALQGVAAVGIVAWWGYWFASGSQSHGERCALAYENSFPLADLVLAGALLVAAVRLWRGSLPAIAAFAAGMALSLATLDTTHNLLTGGFTGPLATTFQKALFAVVNGTVGVWTWVALRHQALRPLPLEARGGAPVVLAVALVWTAVGDGCGGALALSGVGVGVLLAALALCARGPVGAWVVAGALAHATLVAALHGVLSAAGAR